MGWPTQAATSPQPINPNDPAQTAARDSLILSWRMDRTELAAIKEREMERRKAVASMLFPNPSKGTQRFDLGSGYAVKLVHKLNYNLEAIDAPDRKAEDGSSLPFIEQMYALADEIEAEGNEGKFLVDRLLKWSCELSVSEYQKLDPNNPTHMRIKKAIDRHLVVKPASPELTLEEPKAS